MRFPNVSAFLLVCTCKIGLYGAWVWSPEMCRFRKLTAWSWTVKKNLFNFNGAPLTVGKHVVQVQPIFLRCKWKNYDSVIKHYWVILTQRLCDTVALKFNGWTLSNYRYLLPITIKDNVHYIMITRLPRAGYKLVVTRVESNHYFFDIMVGYG